MTLARSIAHGSPTDSLSSHGKERFTFFHRFVFAGETKSSKKIAKKTALSADKGSVAE